jgi:hypothetical protein
MDPAAPVRTPNVFFDFKDDEFPARIREEDLVEVATVATRCLSPSCCPPCRPDLALLIGAPFYRTMRTMFEALPVSPESLIAGILSLDRKVTQILGELDLMHLQHLILTSDTQYFRNHPSPFDPSDPVENWLRGVLDADLQVIGVHLHCLQSVSWLDTALASAEETAILLTKACDELDTCTGFHMFLKTLLVVHNHYLATSAATRLSIQQIKDASIKNLVCGPSTHSAVQLAIRILQKENQSWLHFPSQMKYLFQWSQLACRGRTFYGEVRTQKRKLQQLLSNTTVVRSAATAETLQVLAEGYRQVVQITKDLDHLCNRILGFVNCFGDAPDLVVKGGGLPDTVFPFLDSICKLIFLEIASSLQETIM